MNNSDRQTFEQAIAQFRQNETSLALAQFEALATRVDADANVFRWLALSRAKSGDLAGAGDAIERFILQPEAQSDAWLLASNIFADKGEKDKAFAYALRAASAAPPLPAAFNNLGILLSDLSRFDEACDAFYRAIGLNRDYARAYTNVAATELKLGRFTKALTATENILRLQPDNPQAHSSRGRALYELGRLPEAENAWRHALRLQPHLDDAAAQLALLYRRQFRFSDALAIYEFLEQRQSTETWVSVAKGDALWAAAQEDAAQAIWQKILAREPTNLRCRLKLNLSLPETYSDKSHVKKTRDEFGAGLDRLLSLPSVHFLSSNEENLAAIQHANFFLAYQGQNDQSLQRKYAAFVRKILEPIAPHLYAPRPRRPVEERKIRIGFVSSYFYNCTVGNYFVSWIEDLPHDEFEVFVYRTNTKSDELTRRILTRAAKASTTPTSIVPLAEMIISDELDILIYPELGMEGLTFALASFRLAPIQACAWGHPTTSGHEQIDYFFSCRSMEPPNARDHYTEQLILLPGIGTRYAALPITDTLASDRQTFNLPTDRTLYLFPQSLFKIHPDNDALVIEVLRLDPDGTLVMFPGENAAASERFFSRLKRECDRQGVPFSDRIIKQKSVNHEDYKRINALCDVMLDTLYWSGGNTSLDALSVGLPIVTMPGEFMRGRQSAAMLTQLGLDELIAQNRDDYVRLALKLGMESSYRKTISQRILSNRHRLFDDIGTIEALHRELHALVS